MSRRSLHVLFVARWYPSHDQPGRGSFVGDLAAALIATGRADVTVASFDPTHVRGVAGTRVGRAGTAREILNHAVRDPQALNRPRAWGIPAIPVTRLPVILDGDRRHPAQVVDAHAEPLLAFVRGLVERRPIDVIHAHTGLPDGAAALRVADELNLPLVVTEHSSTTADELADPEARDLYRRLLDSPHRVVAVSRALAHDVARALGLSDKAIAILPNAVPVDDFWAGSAADREPDELLYVGARKASKGIETLLGAFAAVRAHRPAIRLRMIGSPGQPSDEQRWRALVEDLRIGDAVAFEPAAPRDAVAAAMRRATLFVHPSPHETFGMVAAEALASGLPVAATPSGGVEEILGRDGRFGEIALSSTVPALADAIERALAGAAGVDAAAMRAHVESNYAAPAVARLTLDVYDGVIGQTRSMPRSVALSATAATAATGTGPAEDAPAAETARTFRLPLILALARGQAIERVGLLPDALRDRLTIVTSPRGRYADDRDLPDWSDWLEFDPNRFYEEAVAELEKRAQPSTGLGRLKAAFGPSLETMRTDLAARKEQVRVEGMQRFFEDAIGRMPAVGRSVGPGASPQWIVALDADDIVLAARLGPSVGHVAPGGLRWLADAWDAAGRPV